jgi:hypothetical protein
MGGGTGGVSPAEQTAQRADTLRHRHYAHRHGGHRSASSGTTYATAQDYIDSLNSDTQWVTYDAASQHRQGLQLSGLCPALQDRHQGLGAFDEVDRGQGENNLFGNGQSHSLHFDAELAKAAEGQRRLFRFSDWKDSYPTDYESDLA